MKKVSNNLTKKNLTVCFFGSYDRNFTSNRIINNGLLKNNVDIVIVNAHTPVTRLDSPKDATFFHLIMRVLRKYKIVIEVFKNIEGIKKSDVIYVGYPGHIDVLPAYVVAKIFRKKLVFNPLIVISTGLIEEQGIVSRKSLFGKIIKFGETIIYHACDLVLADTPFQKDHLVNQFNLNEGKIKILPIGADDEIYPFAPKLKDDGYFNVVYYGLFSPIHGVEHLIKAAKQLEKEKKIRFIFVGKGNTYDKDRSLAITLKVKNALFYPDMTEVDAFNTLKTADVFIGFLANHPVVQRVVPNKVYQGLALGKTVITAYSPAIESMLINNKNVILAKAANPESIARTILSLKNNPQKNKKVSRNGYRVFSNQFTPLSIGNALKRYLSEL